jgi:nucleotide-binding universal stress UspA family protein
MRIMVPLDTSDLSASAIPQAEELARAMGAELLLVTVLEPRVQASLMQFAEIEGAQFAQVVEDHLRGAAEGIADLAVSTEMLTADDAATALVDRADRGDVDMIVIASHGRSAMQRWMMGSVSERVVRGATVPVLVVPAPWRAIRRS